MTKNSLIVYCEQSWALHGYKKTTIGELAKSIGIATGSFYLLYNSKEELFCATFKRVQERLENKWQQAIDTQPDKEGFIKAMRWLYKEYSQCPFLYDFANPDFLALLNRLPEDERRELNISSFSLLDYTTQVAGLRLKVPQEKAFAALSTILFTVSFADKSVYDHFEIFDLLLEGAISQIFE